jgi:hypothetical protein
MIREQLITAWAKLVATGQDKSHVKASFHTDPEIGRQRLQFEMQKFQEGKQERECVMQEERVERERCD